MPIATLMKMVAAVVRPITRRRRRCTRRGGAGGRRPCGAPRARRRAPGPAPPPPGHGGRARLRTWPIPSRKDLEIDLRRGVRRAQRLEERARPEGGPMIARSTCLVAGALTALVTAPASAQLAAACRGDVQRFCEGTPLGGGRVIRCLE